PPGTDDGCRPGGDDRHASQIVDPAACPPQVSYPLTESPFPKPLSGFPGSPGPLFEVGASHLCCLGEACERLVSLGGVVGPGGGGWVAVSVSHGSVVRSCVADAPVLSGHALFCQARWVCDVNSGPSGGFGL